GEALEQSNGFTQGEWSDLGVYTSLEALACIGGEADSAARSPNLLRVKGCDLEQDVARLTHHFGVGSTHYSGKGDAARGVCDEQRSSRRDTLHAVKRGYRLPRCRLPHDPGVSQPGQVERVHRLTKGVQAAVR